MKARSRNNRKRKWVRFSLLFLGALLIGLSVYLYNVYTNIASAVDNMNQPMARKVSDKRDDKIQFNRKDPISILLVGVDEREGDRGRTDSMLVMTLNPKQKTTKIVSIPRDTRAEMIDRKGKNNFYTKMNHAYAYGGIEMTIDSIENFLNIPIDYYVEVNMEGFIDIVDAVGGIDINSQFEFEQDGTHIRKGKQHLKGSDALNYARMRKKDPRGDFGRQERQREVISQLIKKGTSLKAISNYDKILKALENNVKTNLTLDDMLGIQKLYKTAAETIEKIEIEGTGGLINNGKNNIWYYVVSDEIRQNLSDQLHEHLALPKTKIKPYSQSDNKSKSKETDKVDIPEDEEPYTEPIFDKKPPTGSGVINKPGGGSNTDNGDGSDTGNGGGSDTGNGGGSDTGNGDGSDTGNGDGSDTGNGGGSDTGNGDGSDTGNGDGSDTGNGDGSGTGNGDGSDTGNGDGSGTSNGDGSDTGSGDDDSNQTGTTPVNKI